MQTPVETTRRAPPQLLPPDKELCDLCLNSQKTDLFFSVPLIEPTRIIIDFQEFNSASRCLLLLSSTDPYPSNETAIWRLSSPDPQKTLVIHPADTNYPAGALFLCVRYLEKSGNTLFRIKVSLERNFFAAWFRRDRCQCVPSNKTSIMSTAVETRSSVQRLSEKPRTPSVPLDCDLERKTTGSQRRGFGSLTERSPSYEVVANDEAEDVFHSSPQNFTKSSLYCGEWCGNVEHGRGMKLYAVSSVGQIELEKMYNSAMLMRAIYEQPSIPWTASSLQTSFEGSITKKGSLCPLEVENCRGWSIIPLIERGMEAFDGYWVNGSKEGMGVYQWQDRSYVGEWVGGMREGYGVLEKRDGSCYRGQWHLDHRHGHGKMFDINTETTFTGEWCSGLRDGAGRLEYKSGVVVLGEWKKDTLIPEVQASFPNGSKYEGGWDNDRRHGAGVWTDPRDCVFRNTWVADRKEGEGSIHFTNGVVFYGVWKNDEVESGAYHFPNGDVYTGQWNESTLMRSGFGRCVSKNGDVYEGEWHCDLRHGQGKMVYKNTNTTYEGGWVEGVRHGEGVLTTSDGVYEGQFQKDERCGHGIQKAVDGSYYEGGWRHDFRAGRGIYYYAPHDTTYEGIFLHDRLEGYGTSEINSDKDFFEGTWLDGEKHGRGTRILPSGDVMCGVWHKGKHQDGHIEYTYADGTKFVGDWRDGMREGLGTQINADGTVYDGSWRDNLPNGSGTLTQLDGSSVQCEWNNGEQVCGKGILTFADGSVYSGDIVDGIPEGQGVLSYPDKTEFQGSFKKGVYLL